ncbi:TRAP transporter small permease [Aquincola tertiaricarbonis]|uniref:TRAP transporter small permease n=1 Tax=Aquincola tertiaricarbonis TaxID=391953 RepID=UPI0009FA66A7|nr:TRAP transporter small permease [Aquincola tertiaricarbonis]
MTSQPASPVRTITPGAGAPISAVERWLVSANRSVLVVLLGVMAALVIANVMCRYLVGISFPWVEEVSRYMMVWAAFLGAGPALRVGGHIAIETLPNALPERAARVLRAALVLVMAATLLTTVWIGAEYTQFGWEQETPVLGWSAGTVYLAIPIGAALALVHLAFVARQWIRSGEWERVEGFDPQAL